MQDYRDVLYDILINAGVHGIAQGKITARMQRVARAPLIHEELNRLRKKGKVQRFTVPNRTTKPTTVWRATVLLLED
jgi:predicted transcriptional regulator